MEEVPISLYLRLEQGEHADLRTVSQSALAFTQIIEEIAAELFPGSAVRVEAVDATEASFGWNTITKLFADVKAGVLAGARKHPKAAYLAAYVALRILNNGVDWTQDQVMDWLAGKDAPAEVRGLPEEQRRALAHDIVEELRKGVAQAPTDTLYRELRRDQKVDAVGVTVRPSERPDRLVPRSAFSIDRGPVVPEDQRRVTQRHIEATLISPVLAAGDRRWKFRSATGEFGAPIKDAAFLNDVLTGNTDLRLRAGVVLDIELEVTEQFLDGVWTVENRAVTTVYGWRSAPEQGDLLAPLSGDVQEGQEADEE